jgi:hypothetical protein
MHALLERFVGLMITREDRARASGLLPLPIARDIGVPILAVVLDCLAHLAHPWRS